MTYRVLLGLDSLAALVVVYFFAVGLADGSVSAFNGELWAGLLLGVAAVIGGGMLLQRAGRPLLANALLAVLALPTALYGFFMAVVLLSGASWN
jgi:hypothetical protein